jgi:hypothetical protein
MSVEILVCGILKEEMELVSQNEDVKLNYLDPGLHTDLNRLEKAVIKALDEIDQDNTLVVIGTRCHPDMEQLVKNRGGRIIRAGNCIEIILGKNKLQELDKEANNFYITGGWLENWRKIFVEELKWEDVDARQNFGWYDRILLLDTGTTPISEEKIIEFFDYTGVPVEIMEVNLDNLRRLVEIY